MRTNVFLVVCVLQKQYHQCGIFSAQRQLKEETRKEVQYKDRWGIINKVVNSRICVYRLCIGSIGKFGVVGNRKIIQHLLWFSNIKWLFLFFNRFCLHDVNFKICLLRNDVIISQPDSSCRAHQNDMDVETWPSRWKRTGNATKHL